MDDKNKSLEDFLRNKLSEFANSNDNWDRPDADIWQQAQAEIPPFQKPVISNPMTFVAATLGILLFAASGYVFYLKNQNTQVEEILKEQQAIIEKTDLRIAALEENFENKESVLISKNEQLFTRIEKVKIENEGLKKRISVNGKNAKITANSRSLNYKGLADFENSPNQLSEKTTDASSSMFSINAIDSTAHKFQEASESKTSNNLEIASSKILSVENSGDKKIEIESFGQLPKKYFLTQPKYTFKLPSVTAQAAPPKIARKARTRKQFEIGYEYSNLNFPFPSSEFSKIEKGEFVDILYKNDFSGANGLTFGFLLKENLLIKTGFRYSKATLESSSKLVKKYDKSKEYLKASGDFGNDLSLWSQTPYSEEQIDISLDIPKDFDLDSEDLLFMIIAKQQELTYYQVPIGVEYFLGKKRFQWGLQGGLHWNQFKFKNQLAAGEIVVKDEKLAAEKFEFNLKSDTSKQFLGGYAGAGLSYQLHGGLYARTSMIFNYNFINTFNQFSKSDLIARDFKAGLSYRF